MFYGVLVFIFVIVSILLMAIILLQSSQTGGMGTAMGGQAMNAAFGGQGADKLLVRITSFLAFTFMILALLIGYIGNPASQVISPENPTLGRNKLSNTNSDSGLEIPLDVPKNANTKEENQNLKDQ